MPERWSLPHSLSLSSSSPVQLKMKASSSKAAPAAPPAAVAPAAQAAAAEPVAPAAQAAAAEPVAPAAQAAAAEPVGPAAEAAPAVYRPYTTSGTSRPDYRLAPYYAAAQAEDTCLLDQQSFIKRLSTQLPSHDCAPGPGRPWCSECSSRPACKTSSMC